MIMENDKELQEVLENKKWTAKVYAYIEATVIAIVAIIGLIFGKLVEATLFEEIAKWALMAVVIGLIVCVIFYVPVTMLSDARLRLRPQYGKGWFKEALKYIFGKNKK